MVWSVSRVKAVFFFGDADQFICISVNGNGKIECILPQCSHADEKSGVYDLYRKPGSFANLSVLLPAVWDIRGIWLALPVTAGIMTGIYGLIRKDRKNEE